MEANTLLYNLCNSRKWPDARKYLSSDASDEEKKQNVMHRSTKGRTCLHRACFKSAPDHIFKALIDIGGTELVIMKYGSNRTALHWALCEGASYKSCNAVIKMLIDVGGKDLVMAKDQDGNTALHNLCYHINSHTETANKTKLLLEVSDANVLLTTKNKYGKSPLQIATSKDASDEIKILLTPQTNFSSSKVENNASSIIAPADNSSDHPIEQSHYRQQMSAQNSFVGTNDSNDAVRKLHAQFKEFQKQLKKFQQDYDQKCAECFNLQNTNRVERKEKLRLTRALTKKDLTLQQTNRRHNAAFEQESNKSKIKIQIDILQQQKEKSESRVDNLIESKRPRFNQ
jgi:ankyrin repeat protein